MTTDQKAALVILIASAGILTVVAFLISVAVRGGMKHGRAVSIVAAMLVAGGILCAGALAGENLIVGILTR